MDDSEIDDAIMAVSIIAALLGVAMLPSGNISALGPLIVGVLGLLYLKTDVDPLSRWRQTEKTATDATEDPLTTVRQRYAAGEIDRAEFERRLDDLLETETMEQAKDHHEKTASTERSQEKA